MSGIINSFFGNNSNKGADETMIFNALSSTANSAMAYLAATLDASTPEVRRLFSDYCTQSVLAHEALTALAIKKGWSSPYDTPSQQLQHAITDSQSVLNVQQ